MNKEASSLLARFGKFFVVPCLLAASGVSQVPGLLPEGYWHPAYNWGNALLPAINTIHVGLIPRGPHQGEIVFITWSGGRYWGILDPEKNGPTQPPAPDFVGLWTITAGDPYGRFPAWMEVPCSGHAWTADGRWFVAGGSPLNCPAPASKHTWIYDPDVVSLGIPGAPPEGAWYLQKDMVNTRYYPTAIMTGADDPRGVMTVNGGSIDCVGQGGTSPMRDDFEAFRAGDRHWPPVDPAIVQPTDPRLGQWLPHSGTQLLYPGPGVQTGGQGDFNWYPRLFVLPEGRMVLTAIENRSCKSRLPVTLPTLASDWMTLGWRTLNGFNFYGAAVLYPNLSAPYTNTVMNIGGPWDDDADPLTPLVAVDNVEWANAAQSGAGLWPLGYDWTNWNSSVGPERKPPKLNVRRAECTAVILPTSEILVLHNGDPSVPNAKRPELLSNGTWKLMAIEASRRIHHACALLLPSGRVISMAGGWSDGLVDRDHDFQVFDPPYMYQNRPAWVTTIGTLATRGQNNTATISLPAGTSVGSVVLMRPGSLTHHADMDQRYVKLEVIGDLTTSTVVTFKSPDGPPGAAGVAAPLGYWMIFLVTNTGVPSVAQFVQFQ